MHSRANVIKNWLLTLSNLSKLWTILVILITLIFALGSSAISVNRLWQYDAQYYDFGIFDTALWQASRFKPPIIDHFSNASGKLIFADHFSPAIFLLVPLYWIFPWSETILVAQAVIVALSGLVIFAIAKKVLFNPMVSFIVVATYFLYAGLQNALWFDFHEVTILTLPLTLLLYFFITKNKKMHFIIFILCLLFKETLFTFGIGWAVFIFFYRRQWKHQAITMGLVSVCWYFLTTKLLIPYFRGEDYFYEINTTNLTTLSNWILYIFTPLYKIKYVFLSMLSFGMSLLLVPELSVVFMLHYLSRFLSDAPQRHTLGLHYNAEIAPLFAFAMIIGLSRFKEYFSRKFKFKYAHIWLSVLILCISLFLYQFVTKGPFRLAYISDFYKNTNNFTYLDKLRKQIPSDATVSAQSNLASRLTHQKQLWILWDNYLQHQPDYIFIDIRDGQNPANYSGIKDVGVLHSIIEKDENYLLVDRQDKAFLYKRLP